MRGLRLVAVGQLNTELASRRVLGAVVGAAGGRSRGCIGGVRRRRVLPSGGPAQTRLRAESAKFVKFASLPLIKLERRPPL
jgi:hypothetical protein